MNTDNFAVDSKTNSAVSLARVQVFIISEETGTVPFYVDPR